VRKDPSPLKNSRGPPVEKHWFRIFFHLSNLISSTQIKDIFDPMKVC
jgi:hypothetical protein